MTYHFKAKRAVDHEQDKVGNLANINHAVDVVVALDKREPSLLAADNSNGALGLVEGLFRIAADEGL